MYVIRYHGLYLMSHERGEFTHDAAKAQMFPNETHARSTAGIMSWYPPAGVNYSDLKVESI